MLSRLAAAALPTGRRCVVVFQSPCKPLLKHVPRTKLSSTSTLALTSSFTTTTSPAADTSPTTFTSSDHLSMAHALECARSSLRYNDVPVGAIIVRDDDGFVLGEGYNKRERDKSSIAHAEICAIQRASEMLNSWKLNDTGACTMYVTLEPCLMCYTAASQARISRIVYGAKSQVASKGMTPTRKAIESIKLNHMPTMEYMKMEDSETMLKDFFQDLRKTV